MNKMENMLTNPPFWKQRKLNAVLSLFSLAYGNVKSRELFEKQQQQQQKALIPPAVCFLSWFVSCASVLKLIVMDGGLS